MSDFNSKSRTLWKNLELFIKIDKKKNLLGKASLDKNVQNYKLKKHHKRN